MSKLRCSAVPPPMSLAFSQQYRLLTAADSQTCAAPWDDGDSGDCNGGNNYNHGNRSLTSYRGMDNNSMVGSSSAAVCTGNEVTSMATYMERHAPDGEGAPTSNNEICGIARGSWESRPQKNFNFWQCVCGYSGHGNTGATADVSHAIPGPTAAYRDGKVRHSGHSKGNTAGAATVQQQQRSDNGFPYDQSYATSILTASPTLSPSSAHAEPALRSLQPSLAHTDPTDSFPSPGQQVAAPFAAFLSLASQQPTVSSSQPSVAYSNTAANDDSTAYNDSTTAMAQVAVPTTMSPTPSPTSIATVIAQKPTLHHLRQQPD